MKYKNIIKEAYKCFDHCKGYCPTSFKDPHLSDICFYCLKNIKKLKPPDNLKDYLREDEVMKSENEKDFLKHFEKYLNSVDEISILAGKVKHQYALNDRIHNDLKKDMNRIFFRYPVIEKHCKSLIDNADKMKSLLTEE